jgi:hypothetical protein
LMSEGEVTAQVPSPASRWREAAERLRSNARVYVVSLGAVAVTVVAGLSLTGLSTLEPWSAHFNFAVAGALFATLGVVVMLALAMRLSSASAVSMAELLELNDSKASEASKEELKKLQKLQWRRPGHRFARGVVNAKSNGYLAGYDTLEDFNIAVGEANEEERIKGDAAAAAPTDEDAYDEYVAAALKADWYQGQLQALIEAASYQRLRWNFMVTARLMTAVGAITAVGIIMYAAALQPRGVPSSPVAVTTHESIEIKVPESSAAAALYENVVGCREPVRALVVGAGDASVSAITIPESECRSVTLNAAWDGTGYVAKFDLPEENE